MKGYVQEKLSEEVHKVLQHLNSILSDLFDFVCQISEAVSQLQQQSNSQPKNTNQTRLISGELEGDVEDPLAALQEVNLRLLQSNSRFMSLDSHLHQTNSSVGELKDLLLSQQYQLEDLRQSLHKMPAPVVEVPKSPKKVEIVREIIPTPIAAQQQAVIVVVEEAKAPPVVIAQEEKPIDIKPDVSAAPMKGEMKPLITAEPIMQQKREEVGVPVAVVSGHDLPDVTIEPKKKTFAVVAAEPEVKEEIVEFKPKQIIDDPSPTSAKPANIRTTFPASYFTGHVPPYAKDVTVELEADLSVVDVVFEIRKVIANQLKLPFKTICLVLDSRPVKLGVDIDEDVPFTAQDTVEYAQNGRLSVLFERTQLVANDLIDRLAPSWEAAAEAKSSQNNTIDKAEDLKASQKSSKVFSKQMSGSFAARRKYDDEDIYGDEEKKRGFKASYASTRSSFEQLMNDLSERRSLTDDELATKRKELDAASNSDSDGQRAYRASLTHAMGALAVESGSESAGDEFFRQSVRLSRQDWTTTMMPDFLSLRSSSSKRTGVAESMALRQSTASRSRRAREAEEWEQEDSLPMMSSLSGPPLRYANNNDGRDDRYEEDEDEQRYHHHDSMMDDDDTYRHRGGDTKRGDAKSATPAPVVTAASAAVAAVPVVASQPKAQQEEQAPERQFKMPKNADSSPQKRVTLPPQQQKSSSVEDREELYDTIPLASQSSTQWGNNSRYVEEPTPSFISSVGRDSGEDAVKGFKAAPVAASTAEGLYLGNTGGTTSGSSAMSTMGFSSTLESSGEINKFDTMEIRNAADRYEHGGGGSREDVMAFDNTAGEISALEMTMNTEDGDISKASSDSPFRDYRRRGLGGGERGTGTLTTVQTHDLDTMSTHSLAISAVSD